MGIKRYTKEFLWANEEIETKLHNDFNALYEIWKNGDVGVNETELNFVLNQFPAEWIAETYFNRFRNIRWEDDDAKLIFAEEIILPYCIKKGILVKKKGKKDY